MLCDACDDGDCLFCNDCFCDSLNSNEGIPVKLVYDKLVGREKAVKEGDWIRYNGEACIVNCFEEGKALIAILSVKKEVYSFVHCVDLKMIWIDN